MRHKKYYYKKEMPVQKPLGKELCRCIKKVRKTVKVRPGQNKSIKGKEKAAIGICVKSVLQTRGKTLKRFKCTPKPYIRTQALKSNH
jgi:hypothetical protein